MRKKRDVIEALKANPNGKFSMKELCDAMLIEWTNKDELYNCLSINNMNKNEELKTKNHIKDAEANIELIRKANPLVYEAFEYLGYEMFNETNYRIEVINKKLSEIKAAHLHSDSIYEAIGQRYELNKWYAVSDLKTFFTDLFSTLGIKTTPVATTINAFYNAEFKSIRINSKKTASFRLIQKLEKVDSAKIHRTVIRKKIPKVNNMKGCK